MPGVLDRVDAMTPDARANLQALAENELNSGSDLVRERAATILDLLRENADHAALVARIEALADEWGCNCDPSPEGQHHEWCSHYYGESLRGLIDGDHTALDRIRADERERLQPLVSALAKVIDMYRHLVMDTDEDQRLHAEIMALAERALGIARAGGNP
jgi:hypothetical protein